jgi:hypothetical protein
VLSRTAPKFKDFWLMIIFCFLVVVIAIYLGYMIYSVFSPPKTLLGGDKILYCLILLIGYILGAWWPNFYRRYKKTQPDTNTLEDDLLSQYLKKSYHQFPPEVFVKLTLLKISKEDNNLLYELTNLIDSYIKKQAVTEKPLLTKERDTLLIIIATLAKEANYDLSATSKSAALISKNTQELGAYISEGAIADKLKQIPDALERKNK